VTNDGNLTVVSASVATHQTAACWVTVSKDGKYAYTGNPTSDSLTGFKVANNGELILLNSDGRTGTTAPGSAPQDEAISQDGRFLYVLDVKVGKISAFKIEQNGQLTALSDFGGLPTGSVGLTAR
jgi:6-phosphogluconolactonase